MFDVVVGWDGSRSYADAEARNHSQLLLCRQTPPTEGKHFGLLRQAGAPGRAHNQAVIASLRFEASTINPFSQY